MNFTTVLLGRIQSIPGVQSVGAVMWPPLSGGCWSKPFEFEGQPTPLPAEIPNTDFNAVTPEYFRTLGVAMRQGRYFDERDGPDAPPVAIINAAWRRRWPNELSIGKRLRERLPGPPMPWLTVVGVVEDVKRYGLDSPFRTEVYRPFRQNPTSFMTILVHSGRDHEIHMLDGGLPIAGNRDG